MVRAVELRSRGFQALVKELGWVNAVRFLREYEAGGGDYVCSSGGDRDDDARARVTIGR